MKNIKGSGFNPLKGFSFSLVKLQKKTHKIYMRDNEMTFTHDL